jgi:hypothetical protein
MRQPEKNILKNEGENYIRKEQHYRNEINPQYTSSVLVRVIESQKRRCGNMQYIHKNVWKP